MTKASVSLNFDEALKDMSTVIDIFKLDETAVNTALIRAINRTLVTIRKSLAQKISSETGVKNRVIKGRFSLFKSSTKFRRGRVSFLAAGVPASILGYRELKRGGVSYGGKKNPQAFVRTPRRRKRGKIREMIFQRLGPRRLPLFEHRLKILEQSIGVFELEENQVYGRFLKFLEQELIFRAKAFKP